MSTYKELIGKPVKYLSSDPTDAGAEGQIWYNSTSGTFKSVLSTGAWSSGGTLSTARSGGGTGGISTDAIVAGGASSSPQEAARISGTEIYNGTSWTSSPNIGASRYGAQGAGKTSSTGLLIGGYSGPTNYTGLTEEYNGSAWSESGDLSTGRGYSFTGGLQTAAWAAGGRYGPPFGNTNVTENYNGTSWTTSGTLPMPAIYNGGGSGPQTAGFAAGGIDSAVFTNSQFYDSSTWTAGPSINTGRENLVGSGDSTTALIFGGNIPPFTAQSESWNGTSWSVDVSLGTATNGANGGEVGTATAAIAVGGRIPPDVYTTKTEEFAYTIYSPIAATWSSGGNANTARRGIASAKNGTQNAALGAMGYTGSNTGVANAEEYDGSTWSNISALPTSRYFGGGFGIQTAAVIFGGYSFPTQRNNTDEWNGSAWGTGGTLPSGQSNFAADGCGIENAGLATLGLPGPSPTTIHYDGSTWTIVPGTLNSTRTAGSSFGTQTAAIAATGDTPGGSSLSSESYNGTVWTSTPNAIYGAYGNGAGGTQAAGFIGGSYPNGTSSQGWDGSSWSAIPSLSTGRTESGGAGSATAGLVFTGATTNPTTYTAATEEYTGEIPQLNFKTLTSS